MCDKAGNNCLVVSDSVGCKEPFKYFPGRYKKIFDKAVNACQSALKYVPDCFVTNKMLVKLGNVVFSNDNNSHISAFFSGGMGLVTKDFNNINLDNDKFDKHDSTNIVLIDLLLCVILM